MHELLDKLNPMQRKAVELTDGPQLIIAGAGSGKTRVITHKIAYLIKEKHVPPWRIFAATFTNKAANEMKERVISLLKLPGEVKLNISTFHSLCAGFLRREAPKVGLSPHYTIVDERDQLAVIRDCLNGMETVSYTHLRAHETVLDLVCRLLLEKKNHRPKNTTHHPKTHIIVYNNHKRITSI